LLELILHFDNQFAMMIAKVSPMRIRKTYLDFFRNYMIMGRSQLYDKTRNCECIFVIVILQYVLNRLSLINNYRFFCNYTIENFELLLL